MRSTTVSLALAAVILPAVAGAQQWRTIESARQLTSTDATTVSVTFAGGKFELAPLPGKLLYQMQIHYDEQVADAAERQVRMQDGRVVGSAISTHSATAPVVLT